MTAHSVTISNADEFPDRDLGEYASANGAAPASPPRIVFLYSEPSPYIVACWRELKQRYDARLLIIHWDPNPEAPFVFDVDAVGTGVRRKGLSKKEITRRVLEFQPDGVFISGWLDWTYMQVAAQCKRRGIPVILGLDTQWRGTPKQIFGIATAPLWLRPSVTAIWTPGERQAQLARRLGYRGANCWYGVYCCDWDSFADGSQSARRAHSFLYVGRYVEDKGISDLIEAYRIYRKTSKDPWPLYCAGTGSLRHLLKEVPGIVDLGFIEPGGLPRVMRQFGGVFVLPSRVEPWGVVLQEAAASGCPLICSDACGAGVHMLQNGYNGLRFAAGKADELARCMLQLATAAPERRAQMGSASVALASQFTPERWAQTIVEGIAKRPVQQTNFLRRARAAR